MDKKKQSQKMKKAEIEKAVQKERRAIDKRNSADSEKLKKNILIVATVVVIIATIASIIFVNSLEDTTKKEEPVAKEETVYPEKKNNGSDRIDPELIKTIVLSNDGSETEYTYRFEVTVRENQKELVFTCWYETEDGTISCTSEEINTSRLSDITSIIERYSVAETIKKYREAPNDNASRIVEGGKELEISWYDGDHVSLGFPNGAGKALEKYFIELAEWLHSKKY